ncbi:TolC family protein [Pelagerythrobacter marensis]|uniref:TolC family protein n=1 Tax=Pelagerythrobacter marensis TaxID=543877 RepID=A0ABZ2D882_9SPHN
MIRTFPLFAAGSFLAGCAAVGPDYEAPATAVTDAWIEPVSAGAVDPAWWRQFGDEGLTALIERAMAGSPTVEQARARLAEARANRDAVVGRRLPEVGAQAAATENRIAENGQIPVGQVPGFDPRFSLFDLGFDASWEVDLWGRRTREAQGAEARVGAAEAGLHDVLVVLGAEIARSYMDLREAQASIAQVAASAGAQGELARLTTLRYRAGESSKLDADRAAAEAAVAEQRLADVRARESAAAYRLATLVGEPPEALVPMLRNDGPVPASPETILVGVRSQLLRRRPDVRIAERELAAAVADVGVATADLFPRFSLVGGIGTQSRAAGDLFGSESLRFSLGPTFSWPIFSGGRIRAQIRAADARADVAAARYENAVIEALADSESAINRYLEAQNAEAAAARALAAQREAFALAERRFALGEDDRLSHERARLEMLARQQAFSQARADTARAAIGVFKALGGGWRAGAESAPGPAHRGPQD